MLEVWSAEGISGSQRQDGPWKPRAVGDYRREAPGSVHHLGQLPLFVLGSDDLQALALDLAGLAFAAEFDVALLADLLGGLARRLEPFAGVELLGVLRQELAHRAGHREADVGVDVDLAHAVLDR